MARRTKEEALETREQVLDAAEQVFRERGVGHASLAEVADAAGVTRGAIDPHFASKAELFEAMLARAEMPLDAAFDAPQLPVADPLGTVRETAIKALLHLTSSDRVRNIFDVAFLLHYISQYLVLDPGDLVNTGTPPGVAMGMAQPAWLQSGDEMVLGISGLGEQRQACVPST